MQVDISIYLPPLIELAQQAAAAILDIYQRSRQFDVQSKSDSSPLTQADILAHEIIAKGLQQLTPDLPILSEEGWQPPYSERQQWQRYWLIDPLDGTKEFVAHSGEFSINIALIEQRRPILGLIYIPVADTVYYACRGLGAFKQSWDHLPVECHIKPWQPPMPVVLAVGNRYRLPKLQPLLDHLGAYEIISAGSAYKFCLIAEGKADLYPRFGPTSEWDTAAGQIIVEEAGGIVVDLNWQPLQYNAKASLLNSHFFAIGNANALAVKLKPIMQTFRGELHGKKTS
jgi:3'(2'), 5'-bisphosphate nucleotidase